MNRLVGQAVVILALLLAPHRAFTQELFSGGSTCTSGTLISWKSNVFGSSVEKQSVGTFFRLKRNSSLLVLAAAHAVHGADHHAITCEGFTLTNLVVIGISETLDLAVLAPRFISDESKFRAAFINEAVPEEQVPPLPILSDADENLHTRDPYWEERGKSQAVFIPEIPGNLMKRADGRAYRWATDYWPGYSSVLIISDLDAEPGMSGSPVYSSLDPALPEDRTKPSFLGILTRTEPNTALSLALNFQDIRKYLDKLSAGLDPWKSNNPTMPFFDYEYVDHDTYIQKYRLLRIPLSPQVLREDCSSGKFAQTLEIVSNDDSFASYREPFVFVGPSHNRRTSMTNSRRLRLQKASCNSEGALDDLGRRRIGYLNPHTRKLIRATALEDWMQLFSMSVADFYRAIVEEPQNQAYFKDYTALCQSTSWGRKPNLKTDQAVGTILPPYNPLESGISYAAAFSSRRRSLFASSELSCTDKNRSIQIRYSNVPIYESWSSKKTQGFRNRTDIFSVFLTLSDNYIRGNLRVPGKDIKVIAPRNNFWSNRIDLEEGVLLIDLASGDRLLQIVWIPMTESPRSLAFSRAWYEQTVKSPILIEMKRKQE